MESSLENMHTDCRTMCVKGIFILLKITSTNTYEYVLKLICNFFSEFWVALTQAEVEIHVKCSTKIISFNEI